MPIAVAPAAVVAALGALLFLLAYGQARDAIKQNLHFNVGIGPVSVDLLGWVTDAADYLYAVLIAVLDSWVHPIANFILAPINAVEVIVESSVRAIGNTAAAVANIYYLVIPVLYSIGGQVGSGFSNVYQQLQGISNTITTTTLTLQAWFQTTLTDALGELRQEIANLQGEIAGIPFQVPFNLAAVTAAAVTAAQGVFNDFYARVQGEISIVAQDAQQFATGIYSTVEHDIAVTLVTGEAYTDAAIAAALKGIDITDVDAAIAAGLTAIWPDISAVIPELEGVIGTGDIDILDALGRIDWTIPANLAGVASLVGVTTLTLARFLRDCGIPNCQNLSALGNDLQSLLGLVGDAAFLAFITGLIHDPSGAAQTVRSSFGSVIDGAVTATRDLVSI